MAKLLVIFAALIAVANCADFTGMYKLRKIVDNRQPRKDLNLKAVTLIVTQRRENEYGMSFKVGNILNGVLTVYGEKSTLSELATTYIRVDENSGKIEDLLQQLQKKYKGHKYVPLVNELKLKGEKLKFVFQRINNDSMIKGY